MAALMFVFAGTLGFGQATSTSDAKPGSAPKPGIAASDQAILVFKVRIAFSLDAQMVQTMQSKTAATQGGNLASSPSDLQSGHLASPATTQQAAKSNDGSKEPAWGDALVRNVPPETTFEVRLVGQTLIILLQIIPINTTKTGTGLVLQSQVWYQAPGAPLSFKTSVQNLSILYGNIFYFYPLGADIKTGAPLAMEIEVDKNQK
jgi:hypothetical protein